MDKFQELEGKLRLAIKRYEDELTRLEEASSAEDEEHQENDRQCVILKEKLAKINDNLELLQEYDGKNILGHTLWLVIKFFLKDIRRVIKQKEWSTMFGIIISIGAMGYIVFSGILAIVVATLLITGLFGIFTLPFREKVKNLRLKTSVSELEVEKKTTEEKIGILEKKMEGHEERSASISVYLQVIQHTIEQCQVDLMAVTISRNDVLDCLVSEEALNNMFDKMNFDDIIKRTRDKKEGIKDGEII